MIKTETIKKNYEFKDMFTKGKLISGKNVAIYYIENKTNINRIGIAINKKVGKSVVRNRLKRLFRESYTILETEVKYGFDIVFIWKKTADLEQAGFRNIKEDVENVFKKAGII